MHALRLGRNNGPSQDGTDPTSRDRSHAPGRRRPTSRQEKLRPPLASPCAPQRRSHRTRPPRRAGTRRTSTQSCPRPKWHTSQGTAEDRHEERAHGEPQLGCHQRRLVADENYPQPTWHTSQVTAKDRHDERAHGDFNLPAADAAHEQNHPSQSPSRAARDGARATGRPPS